MFIEKCGAMRQNVDCVYVCVRIYVHGGHEWMNRYTSHLVKLFKYHIKYLASVIFYGRFVLYTTTIQIPTIQPTWSLYSITYISHTTLKCYRMYTIHTWTYSDQLQLDKLNFSKICFIHTRAFNFCVLMKWICGSEIFFIKVK